MFSVVTLRFGLFISVQMFSVTKYSIGKYYQHITAVPESACKHQPCSHRTDPAYSGFLLAEENTKKSNKSLINSHKKLLCG